jgi:hypothetical protein
MQTASGAAALHGAYKIYEDGKGVSGISTAGATEATRNGYTDGENDVTLTVNSPPSQGPNDGNDYAAEALLTKQQSPMLASLFHKDDVTIGTRSVAVMRVTGPFCVLALSPSNDSALKFGGTSDLNLESCGIIVNSIFEGAGPQSGRGLTKARSNSSGNAHRRVTNRAAIYVAFMLP